MSLYLKYRPQDFKSLVGQVYVKQTIQSAMASSQLAHAYLFCGPRGTGKTSLARILAKRLNCQNPIENEPCNQCEMCIAIGQGRLVDLIEIDAASNRGIDEIRELREKIVFAPSQAKYKVYIIDEVHMLTKEAFNALLKTLEEPPSHAYFILATTEAHKIPETIVSRCQQFRFNRIGVEEMQQRLEEIARLESAEFEPEAMSLIAQLSEGGLRDGIGLLEQMMLNGKVTYQSVVTHLGLTGDIHLKEFFVCLEASQTANAIQLLHKVVDEGKSVPQFLKEVIAHMRQNMLSHLENPSHAEKISQWIDVFLKAKSQLDLSPIPALPIEMAIIKVCGTHSSPGQASSVKQVSKQLSKAKQVNQVPEPEKKEAMVEVETAKVELQLDQVKKDWSRVLDGIQTPFVKLSLADGELVDMNQQELRIRFKSKTFLDNVKEAKHQKEIQTVIKSVYGTQITLQLEAKAEPSQSIPQEVATGPETDASSLAQMAAEVFGSK